MRHVVFGDAGVSHEVLYLALSCMIYSLLQRNPNLRKREAPTTLNYPIRCHSGLDHEQTVRAKMAAPSESISQTFFCQAATFFLQDCDFINLIDEDGTFLANIGQPKVWTAR